MIIIIIIITRFIRYQDRDIPAIFLPVSQTEYLTEGGSFQGGAAAFTDFSARLATF